MKYLALWELGKKQDYIFKSNKLKECIGASSIIRELSEDFDKYSLNEENYIIKGGGKIVYAFSSNDERESFIKKFSLDTLKKHEGLELFIVTEDYDDSKDRTIKDAIDDIYCKLEEKKRMRKNLCGQIGYGIERRCITTGGPSSSWDFDDDTKEYISEEIKDKRDSADKLQDKKLSKLIPSGYNLLKTLDDMTNDEAKSYIAIVHIDGNRMGKKIQTISQSISIADGEDVKDFNNRYVQAMIKFSNEIAKANENAFKYMCQIVDDNKDGLKKVSKIDEGKFPVRPMILAGDDVTFICNGSIAVECAEIFINKLKEYTIDIDGINEDEFKRINACAGVCIVKKTYPFIKAYEMAEQLCESAKTFLGDKKGRYSAIDFHLSQGNISENLDSIRKNNYFTKENKMTMKPLLVGETADFGEDEWRNYKSFIESLEHIEEAIQNKVIARSKVKELREKLYEGENAVKRFYKFYKIDEHKYLTRLENTFGDFCFNNDKDNTCIYMDAIEIMDLFEKLQRNMEG